MQVIAVVIFNFMSVIYSGVRKIFLRMGILMKLILMLAFIVSRNLSIELISRLFL